MSAIEFFENTLANFLSLAFDQRVCILIGVSLTYFAIFMFIDLLIQGIIYLIKRWGKKHG